MNPIEGEQLEAAEIERQPRPETDREINDGNGQSLKQNVGADISLERVQGMANAAVGVRGMKGGARVLDGGHFGNSRFPLAA